MGRPIPDPRRSVRHTFPFHRARQSRTSRPRASRNSRLEIPDSDRADHETPLATLAPETICNKERPKARLAAVFGQPVRIRRNHLRSAIPTLAFTIHTKPLTKVIARYALCSQRRIGNRQAIRKRRTQQAILYRAPKRRHPHAVDLFKRTRRLRTQQPASCTQRHRATCLNKKSRPKQIIRHLQTPQKWRLR